jgi:hypothetical protein
MQASSQGLCQGKARSARPRIRHFILDKAPLDPVFCCSGRKLGLYYCIARENSGRSVCDKVMQEKYVEGCWEVLSERGMRLVQVTMRKDDLTEEADFEVGSIPFFSPTFSCQLPSTAPQMFLCFGAQ